MITILLGKNLTLSGELVQLTKDKVHVIKGIGWASLAAITSALAEEGLSLGMKIDDWPAMLERWKAEQAQEAAKRKAEIEREEEEEDEDEDDWEDDDDDGLDEEE